MRRLLTLLLLTVATLLPAFAQRTVTPVETDDKKPAQPTLHYYDKHGKPLDEPVLFLATLDTVSAKKTNSGPIYPKLSALSVGLNFWDGIMAIAGQKYGGADLWAELSLWNWLSPVAEIGIGGANRTPDGNNYTYKGKAAFYAKLGFNYNFLYKSSPDYQVFAGFRAGFSHFSFDLNDITVSSGYWDQSQKFSLTGFSSSAFYGEALAGIKVKIAGPISMGWSVRYRFLFHSKPANLKAVVSSTGAPFNPSQLSNGAEATPWYIPGYGSRDTHFGFTFSVIYTLPLNKEKYPKPDDATEDTAEPLPAPAPVPTETEITVPERPEY